MVAFFRLLFSTFTFSFNIIIIIKRNTALPLLSEMSWYKYKQAVLHAFLYLLSDELKNYSRS